MTNKAFCDGDISALFESTFSRASQSAPVAEVDLQCRSTSNGTIQSQLLSGMSVCISRIQLGMSLDGIVLTESQERECAAIRARLQDLLQTVVYSRNLAG